MRKVGNLISDKYKMAITSQIGWCLLTGMLAGRGNARWEIALCLVCTSNSRQSYSARLQRWTKVIEIWLGNSIFQPNWNMQKHSYAKSRKSIYFQTQTKIPFFHLRGFLIFNPTGLSFKQSFTIQTRTALSLTVGGRGRGQPPILS